MLDVYHCPTQYLDHHRCQLTPSVLGARLREGCVAADDRQTLPEYGPLGGMELRGLRQVHLTKWRPTVTGGLFG